MKTFQKKPAVALRRSISVQPLITPRENILELIREMVQKGGPDPEDYELMDLTLASMPHYLENDIISQEDLQTIISMCDFLHTTETFMGHSKLKPYGYAGDYAIIEKIYNKTVCEEHAKWDLYSYSHPAAAAVRNRKLYFQHILNKRLSKQEGELRLLNVASGPARDLFELYSHIDPQKLTTTCVEFDKRAIAYAKVLCENYLHRINFLNKNIFKFETEESFDLIWSAGLFDYFDDATFVTILKKFIHEWSSPAGEIVVGNFCTSNPSRPYMELFGEWHLNHRSADHLYRLAIEAGAEVGNIYIDKEPEGVNLFLRIQK
jgi:extracellular factor (EF) 3-hydroxypalmitic acid methyl ester biosynthesis protein